MKILSLLKNMFFKRTPKIGELWKCYYVDEYEAIFEIVDVKKGYVFFKYPYLTDKIISNQMLSTMMETCYFVADSRESWEREEV